MKYDEIQENDSFPLMVMESSEYSPNQCVFRNDKFGVWLYHANCIEFMNMLISKYPDGRFDMIFADPPYFLSNGGKTCYAGRMVSVNKGEWGAGRIREWKIKF